MVGKYTGLSDAYLSVLKALQHACLSASRKLEVLWVEASHLEPAAEVPSHSSLSLHAACWLMFSLPECLLLQNQQLINGLCRVRALQVSLAFESAGRGERGA